MKVTGEHLQALHWAILAADDAMAECLNPFHPSPAIMLPLYKDHQDRLRELIDMAIESANDDAPF